jgi:hypothetical protein
MKCVTTYEPGTVNPFSSLYPYYVLIEVASNNETASDS